MSVIRWSARTPSGAGCEYLVGEGGRYDRDAIAIRDGRLTWRDPNAGDVDRLARRPAGGMDPAVVGHHDDVTGARGVDRGSAEMAG
jgi:hypothetical protein